VEKAIIENPNAALDFWGQGAGGTPIQQGTPLPTQPPQIANPGVITDDEGSSSGVGLIIIIVLLMVCMVIGVGSLLVMIMIVMRRRAHEAQHAQDWETATEHIGLGVAENDNAGSVDQLAAETRDTDTKTLEESAEVSDAAAHEGKEFELPSTEVDDEDENVDGVVPRSQKVQTSPASKKRQAGRSSVPKAPPEDKLDYAGLFRLAQEAADEAVDIFQLSARSGASSKQSSTCEELFETIRSAASGNAGCDDLVLSDAQRAGAERNAKFEALDDELAWSTNDDSRLIQLIEKASSAALGPGNAPNATSQSQELSTGTVASQLLVRPMRPSQKEDSQASAPKDMGALQEGSEEANGRKKHSQPKRKSRNNASPERGRGDRSEDAW
jgi:hypothetical protein